LILVFVKIGEPDLRLQCSGDSPQECHQMVRAPIVLSMAENTYFCDTLAPHMMCIADKDESCKIDCGCHLRFR
ncbi:MAG: hypothetical protein ACRD4I_09465, partial [Candidatus Angelobacter sp.]